MTTNATDASGRAPGPVGSGSSDPATATERPGVTGSLGSLSRRSCVRFVHLHGRTCAACDPAIRELGHWTPHGPTATRQQRWRRRSVVVVAAPVGSRREVVLADRLGESR